MKKSNAAKFVTPMLAIACYFGGAFNALSAPAPARNPIISLQRAAAIALNARPGVVTAKALVGKADVSGLRYSFDIQDGIRSYDVEIDAVLGKVVEISLERRSRRQVAVQ